MRSIIAIIGKDVSRFFSQMIPVTTLLIFYLVMGLILWIMPGSGILDGYYAQVDLFFSVAPVLLLFLIPALNMDAIAAEKNDLTIDLLLTRPVRLSHLVAGKYLSGLLIVVIGLSPSILYVITVYYLGNPVGNLDMGAVYGSYIGLFLLVAVFTSISLFASSLVSIPMTALMLAVFLSAFWYYAFYLMSRLPVFYGVWDYWVQYLGLDFHYEEMGNGLISFHSVVYMLSLVILFLAATRAEILKIRRS